MDNVKITFEDGTVKSYLKGTTYIEILREIPNFKNIIGIIAENKIVYLGDAPLYDEKIKFIYRNSPDGSRIYEAGIKMLFECAVKRLNHEVNVHYAYSLPHGIVAELKGNIQGINQDFAMKLSSEMQNMVNAGMIFKKIWLKNSDGIKYHKRNNSKVKAINIQNITDASIVFYNLGELTNYYYSEMPFATSFLDEFKIWYMYDNLIFINFPTPFSGIQEKEKENNIGVVAEYRKSQQWLDIMKVPYIYGVNKLISSGHIESFVRSCELNFNIDINKAAKEISKNNKIKYVLLSGPSSSGKTTVTKRLSNYLEIYGKTPIVISLDDYFKERVDNPKDENGEYDFECLEALDIKYFEKDMNDLLSGKEVHLPYFDFVTGTKKPSGKKIKLTDNYVLLFEGLHSINPALFTFLPDEEKYKIFVSPYIPIRIDEQNYITTYDLRLLRRIVRDFMTRGYGVEASLKSWNKVRIGEEKYIFPIIHRADKIINTSLSYEVGVLKVLVVPLLYAVPESSPYYYEARRLLNFLKQFFTINCELVPKDSILREFIGGNND